MVKNRKLVKNDKRRPDRAFWLFFGALIKTLLHCSCYCLVVVKSIPYLKSLLLLKPSSIDGHRRSPIGTIITDEGSQEQVKEQSRAEESESERVQENRVTDRLH